MIILAKALLFFGIAMILCPLSIILSDDIKELSKILHYMMIFGGIIVLVAVSGL